MAVKVKSPYWVKVLRHFENKGYIQNGLSIPFLIGARNIVEPNINLLSVEELIFDFASEGITILKCSQIGEFVIGSLDQHTISLRGYYHSIGNIIVTDRSLDQFTSVHDLATHMKNLYAVQIGLKKYSKNYEWADFSSVENEQLNEVLLFNV